MRIVFLLNLNYYQSSHLRSDTVYEEAAHSVGSIDCPDTLATNYEVS